MEELTVTKSGESPV